MENNALKHCEKCGKPVQAWVKKGGTKVLVPVICDCVKAENERWKKMFETQDRERKVQYLRQLCYGSDKKLADCTFNSDNKARPDISRLCMRYVKKWDEVKAKNVGLLFYGSVGTGKTFYAACIANALLANGVSVLWESVSKIQREAQVRHDEIAVFERISECELLILDDLGSESKYLQQLIFNVISERYQSGKPLIITTNLNIEQFKEPHEEWKRVADRVLEMCYPVEINGYSLRRSAVKNDYKERERLLNDD